MLSESILRPGCCSREHIALGQTVWPDETIPPFYFALAHRRSRRTKPDELKEPLSAAERSSFMNWYDGDKRWSNTVTIFHLISLSTHSKRETAPCSSSAFWDSNFECYLPAVYGCCTTTLNTEDLPNGVCLFRLRYQTSQIRFSP